MIRWSEIMEEHKEKLIEALESAYKEAVDCRHMQYIIEIYKNGIIRTWACAAGSSSFSADSWNGESTVVATYCFQNMDKDEYAYTAACEAVEYKIIQESECEIGG